MKNNFLNNLTSEPGIYKMLDKNQRILYIGKALNIKKRVSSYFNRNTNSIKTAKLVEKIFDIQTIITGNEEEALILENTLIKKFKPKYNILLRDDKSYPYIYIDKTHLFPSIKFYRGEKNKAGLFFGPFTQVSKLRYMLNLIQKIFRIRQCEDSYFANRTKPCLQFQIKRCDAPCVGYVSSTDYNELISSSILFLQGKNNSLIDNFNEKMSSLSNEKKYEEASLLRDKIAMIRTITQNNNIIYNKSDMDIITISSIEDKICVDVFMTRDGINLGNKIFDFRDNDEDTDFVLNSFLKQYYLKNKPPNKIITNIKIPDEIILKNLLSRIHNMKISILRGTRKPYNSWVSLCQKNTDDRIKQLFLIKKKKNIFSTLTKELNLCNEINDIICFDISHLSGSNMIGSAVWFDKNGPNKTLYRRYNLTEISKSDDYAALKHVMFRRIGKLASTNSLPSIILVDGGKGQITQAKKILRELGIEAINIFGIVKGHKRLSKNDRVLDNQFKDITVTLTNNSLRVFQKIRDEAHRFAIMGQRRKTAKKQFESKLDQIPGIGEKRKLEILKYFGGIQGVTKSSKNELQNVPGINNQLAETIYKYLHK